MHAGGKTPDSHHHGPFRRLEFASGVRYTRLSLHGEGARLWEATVGVEYSATSWLHLGVEAAYGWFDSDQGSAEGLMVPHAHADVHLPLGGSWELLAGFDVGFPGGEEDLVGDHWEFTPAIELRYERHGWFASAGAGFAFIAGDDHHDHGDHDGESHDEPSEDGHEAHDDADHDEHEAPDEHAHSHGAVHPGKDFHEIVDPHGSRELHYHVAFGVRPFDERLELESRISGVRVASGDTDDRNYVRAGLRASWKLDDRWLVSAQGSVPITEARRNEWQASLAVRVDF